MSIPGEFDVQMPYAAMTVVTRLFLPVIFAQDQLP